MSAQSNLGYCYYYGKGISKDHTLGIYWLKKAAAQGFAQARDILSQIGIKL